MYDYPLDIRDIVHGFCVHKLASCLAAESGRRPACLMLVIALQQDTA
jgi:hypothetical protein